MLDPHNILRLLGIEQGRHYPIATDCPICGERSKLEIRDHSHVHCHACHFIGDLIELLAAKSDQELEETLDELQNLALVDYQGPTRRKYLSEVAERRELLDCLKQWSGRLVERVTGSVRAVFSQFDIYPHPTDVQQMTPHVCLLRHTDFEEKDIPLPKVARAVFRWWGKYSAVGIPCWEGINLVGFWVITVKGCRYLPLVTEAAKGVGFGLVHSFSDEFAAVVDDPITALRLTSWSHTCNRRPSAFLCPHGLRDNFDLCKCGSLVFWTPEGHLSHYLRAIHTPGSRVVNHQQLQPEGRKQLPTQGSWGQFRREMINALPAHQAVAYRLLDVPLDEARPVVSQASLDSGDRAKILSHLAGEDARYVERLFSNSQGDATISWQGKVVSDTEDGWVCQGKVVSAAKFHLEQVRPQGDSGDALIMGTISYRGPDGERYSFPFREKLSQIKKNPARWLQNKVLVTTGFHPYVMDRWSSHLFEISQKFHAPTPVLAEQQYGWHLGKLRMPNFTVDKHNIYSTRSMVNGPGIAHPSPLAPMEWEAFYSQAFCRVFLAFLGNLVRTASGRKGIGLLLTNEPHAVSRLAQAFGTQVQTNPSITEIDEHSQDPLPLFTDWTNCHLAEIFREMDGYRNIILSTDQRTAKLSKLQPDWLQLAIGESIDFGALRAVFILLPHVLRSRELDPDGETLYRDLSALLLPEVAENCRSPRLHAAAVSLDTHNVYKSSTAATRILELILYGVHIGEIKPDYTDMDVSVRKQEFKQTLASPIVPQPPLDELTNRLDDARFLSRDSDRRWYIPRMTWDLNASLVGI